MNRDYELFKAWDYEPMTPFKAVVEPDLPNAFLTRSPRKLPEVPAVPWMTGLNKDEGCLKSVCEYRFTRSGVINLSFTLQTTGRVPVMYVLTVRNYWIFMDSVNCEKPDEGLRAGLERRATVVVKDKRQQYLYLPTYYLIAPLKLLMYLQYVIIL